MRQPSSTRLLTRHFLRRFFDNDLISPHVDLHENMAVACAALVSISLFASVMIGGKYLFGLPPPGVVAIESLGDNFLFVSLSMFAMGLLAALQWDALSLDARDAANLGPLPIARRTIVRAKLCALFLFAGGFIAALNLFPSTVYQALSVVRMPVGVSGLVRLGAGHAVASMLASVFGFVAVVAFRESLRAVLGARLFGHVSAMVQGVLVLALTGGLLLSPVFAASVRNSWFHDGFESASIAPPVWFMGLEQTLGGGAIANVSGVDVPGRMAERNARLVAAYQAHEPFFRACVPKAVMAPIAAFILAALTYAWNLRHAPQPVRSSRRRRAGVNAIGALAAGRDGVRRAGLTFALQALVRSAPHRFAMAAAAALALAVSFVLLGRTGFRPALDASIPPVSILAMQPVVITILLAGYRRAVRVPAELQANWVMQITWRRGERRFLAGVKRAAIVGVALPSLLTLFPLHTWLLSTEVALLHAAIGICYSLAIAEALFAGCVKAPLASSYEPLSHVKTVGPIVFVLFLLFVNAFARVEREALQTGRGVIELSVLLLAAGALLRAADFWITRGAQPMKFDEPPEPATQWLGLSG